MANKEKRGGRRTPGEGKKLGPPYRDQKLRIIKIQCTPEELQRILSQIPDTRRRAEILLAAEWTATENSPRGQRGI